MGGASSLQVLLLPMSQLPIIWLRSLPEEMVRCDTVYYGRHAEKVRGSARKITWLVSRRACPGARALALGLPHRDKPGG